MTDGAAARFVAALHAAHDPADLPAVRRRIGPDDEAIGMRMRDLFAAATPLPAVDGLFDSPVDELRMGALCIVDFRARPGPLGPSWPTDTRTDSMTGPRPSYAHDHVDPDGRSRCDLGPMSRRSAR